MPDVGYYAKKPRPESVNKLVEYLDGNDVVSSAKIVDDQHLVIERTGAKPELSVFLTNIYILGVADVNDIYWSEGGKVDAIVTMSAWNGYSHEAKAWCREKGCGLFTFKEFLGAVYFSGEKFLDYTPPKKD